MIGLKSYENDSCGDEVAVALKAAYGSGDEFDIAGLTRFVRKGSAKHAVRCLYSLVIQRPGDTGFFIRAVFYPPGRALTGESSSRSVSPSSD